MEQLGVRKMEQVLMGPNDDFEGNIQAQDTRYQIPDPRCPMTALNQQGRIDGFGEDTDGASGMGLVDDHLVVI